LNKLMKTVQFDDYGGVEVLEVRDVARPEPGPDQVLVAVRARAAHRVCPTS
jgi:NADPH:quinone reductase-like Zn-dependent oxidoreductase